VRKIAIIAFQMILILPVTTFAGWSEDVQLTYRGFEIMPQIIVRSDTVNIAWQEAAGSMFISHIRSNNNGTNWSEISNLNSIGHRGSFLSLSKNNDKSLIGWSDVDTNPVNWQSNIGFVNSVNNGQWSNPSYVFTRWEDEGYRPSLSLSGDSLYISYMPDLHDSLHNQLILFCFSPDLGSTWSSSQIIARTPMYMNGFQMKKCGSSIYVLWSGMYWPNPLIFEIVTVISHDGGQSWSEMIQLSPDSNASQHPCIACDEETGNVAVGWMDYALSHSYPGDLFMRITTDGGYSWSDIQYATNHHQVSDPGLAIAGDTIWAAWKNVGTAQIAFSKSTDLGSTWSQYEELTHGASAPWLSYDRGRLHMVWSDRRPPVYDQDIYYKRFDPEPDAIEHDILIPESLSLSAYPNPFNSATTITLTGAEQAEIGIYDITGRLIATLHANGGQALWDASAYSSGLYFARGAGEKAGMIKLVLLK
jgi:hypothetical protein